MVVATERTIKIFIRKYNMTFLNMYSLRIANICFKMVVPYFQYVYFFVVFIFICNNEP